MPRRLPHHVHPPPDAEALLELAPGSPDALMYKGHALYHLRDYAAAVGPPAPSIPGWALHCTPQQRLPDGYRRSTPPHSLAT
jgi:hypothetical protein